MNAVTLVLGRGHILFIAHAWISAKEVFCRFHGACAVTRVTLNNDEQKALTRDDRLFVTSLAPMKDGSNELRIETTNEPIARVSTFSPSFPIN